MVVTSRCLLFELKTRQVYFNYPFPRRLKLEKFYKTCCVNLFTLELAFQAEKTRIFKDSFLQNKN